MSHDERTEFVHFVDGACWRVSRRGLLVAPPDGDAVLLTHPKAADLPPLLQRGATRDELVGVLGEPDGARLVEGMLEAGIVNARDSSVGEPGSAAPRRGHRPRVVLTRSGLEIDGIDGLARWLDRHLVPALGAPFGRVLLTLVVIAGTVALLSGPPDGPLVSPRPAVDALFGLALALTLSCLHEVAHAVALVHYGRRPRRAGVGFYWGALSFYVDATEALTLPRRARLVQALAGLAVDVVTLSVLAVLAQVTTPVLLVGVCWRLALLGVLDVLMNALPILDVDGHAAMSDYLDEPDLGGRARAALGNRLLGRGCEEPGWLAVHGAVSFVGGVGLLAAGTAVWWSAFAELLGSLFAGSVAEVAVGVLLVGPFALGLLCSTLGLVLELVPDDGASTRPAVAASGS